MLFTGHEQVDDKGFNPKVINDIQVSRATTAGKVGFWILTILTLGLFYIIARPVKRNRLNSLQMSINEAASQIDIYLEKRFNTLSKLAEVCRSHTQLDKEVYESIAAYRSGIDPKADAHPADQSSFQTIMDKANNLNARQARLDRIWGGFGTHFEQYPQLSSVESIRNLTNGIIIIENEISSARRIYNSVTTQFNQEIYTWPTNVIIDKLNYKALPLFIASEAKRQDVDVSFFN